MGQGETDGFFIVETGQGLVIEHWKLAQCESLSKNDRLSRGITPTVSGYA
jgi:hypothetical protein